MAICPLKIHLFHFCICLCMFSSPYFVHIFHVWFQDLGFLNLVYFACLISPYSLARQCAVLWSKTRESLGHPLGTVAEPNHLVVQKEVLEAAVRKVCVSRLLCSFFIPISFLTLVLLFPFNWLGVGVILLSTSMFDLDNIQNELVCYFNVFLLGLQNYLVTQVHMEPRLFVLEIGTEELPPNDVAHASQEVCNLFWYKFVLPCGSFVVLLNWFLYFVFSTLPFLP